MKIRKRKICNENSINSNASVFGMIMKTVSGLYSLLYKELFGFRDLLKKKTLDLLRKIEPHKYQNLEINLLTAKANTLF